MGQHAHLLCARDHVQPILVPPLPTTVLYYECRYCMYQHAYMYVCTELFTQLQTTRCTISLLLRQPTYKLLYLCSMHPSLTTFTSLASPFPSHPDLPGGAITNLIQYICYRSRLDTLHPSCCVKPRGQLQPRRSGPTHKRAEKQDRGDSSL